MAKSAPKPRLTDRERHARFVAMAREVEASDEPEAFERAFERVVRQPEKPESEDD